MGGRETAGAVFGIISLAVWLVSVICWPEFWVSWVPRHHTTTVHHYWW